MLLSSTIDDELKAARFSLEVTGELNGAESPIFKKPGESGIESPLLALENENSEAIFDSRFFIELGIMEPDVFGYLRCPLKLSTLTFFY